MGRKKKYDEIEKIDQQRKWSNKYYNKKNKFYVYVYLDPRKVGPFYYGEYMFNYEPIYIGKGKGYRYKIHLKMAENNIDDKTFKFYKIKSILNDGLTPIVFKLIENITENRALEYEKQLIKLIGRYDNNSGPLTNLTDGGDGISGYKQKENYLITRRRKINQFDLDGKLVKTWNSIIDAKTSLNIKAPISDSCKGKRLIIGGYIWKYFDENYNSQDILNLIQNQIEKEFTIRQINGKKNSQLIFEINLNGEIIKEWDSASSAARFYGVNKTAICNAITKKRLCNNKIWCKKEKYSISEISTIVEKYKLKKK
jgi:hypothetical protein